MLATLHEYWKAMTVVGAIFLAGATATAWALEVRTEVAEVQQYSRGTRSLQLRSDRRYISDELYRLHRRKKTQPNNPDLDRRIKDMRDDLKDIEEKIKRLK